MIDLAFYHDWFQAEQVEADAWAPRARRRAPRGALPALRILLVQPSGYRVFDGARATATAGRTETLPLGLRG